jgi:hypothetical protein
MFFTEAFYNNKISERKRRKVQIMCKIARKAKSGFLSVESNADQQLCFTIEMATTERNKKNADNVNDKYAHGKEHIYLIFFIIFL